LRTLRVLRTASPEAFADVLHRDLPASLSAIHNNIFRALGERSNRGRIILSSTKFEQLQTMRSFFLNDDDSNFLFF